MKNKFLLILFILIFNTLFSNNNPKIALVLSGGGAKGIAQIPTLSLIDSLNIPIDYVVGTSMGSITGALYAMGYSPDEIYQEAFNADWDLIFSNKKDRKKLFYFQKKDFDKFQVEFILKGITPQAPIALSNGHASYISINNTTSNYEHIKDFNNLVIPFRCNAVDLLTGKEIIFDQGSLSLALRSSSSIPSVFSPIIKNNMLLVDGGVVNNLPIDIAKNLGADIIIGINVSPLKTDVSEINNVFDVLTQSILLKGFDKRNSNIKHANVLIEPDVSSFGLIDYDKQILNKIYKKGYKAAYESINQLLDIKAMLKDSNHKYKLSSIEEDTLKIVNVIINSKDDVVINDIFKDMLFPAQITKNEFLKIISDLRNTNKYSHIDYDFIKSNNDKLTLSIRLNRIPQIIIDNIFVKGNNKLSSSFIKSLFNINTGEKLNIVILKSKINKIYNLDLFESIRYEISEEAGLYNITIYVKELSFHTMKISGLWDSYYKLVGNIKFILFDKPIKKFRFTNEFKFGDNIRENEVHMYYFGNYNYQSKTIPTLKFKNTNNEVAYFDNNGNFIKEIVHNRNYSINMIFPLDHYGYIDLGFNNQKIKYNDLAKIEKLSYYSLNFNIDQINDILYPTSGYQYNINLEESNSDYKYSIYKVDFDHFIPNVSNNKIKFYGNYFYSNFKYIPDNALNDGLIFKNINFIKYDRTLSNSEYDLYTKKLFSYGIEYNYLYKNSLTARFIWHYIESIIFRHNNSKINNIMSYGIGFRVKSLFGPINFMWTHSTKNLYEANDKDSYFFSFGVNLK